MSGRRDAGIDAAKVLGAFLILLCHVTLAYDIYNGTAFAGLPSAFVPPHMSTAEPNVLAFALFVHMGKVGTSLFWTCSVWYMAGSPRVNRSRMAQMCADASLIALLCLAFALVRGWEVTPHYILLSVLPVPFSAYWYVTAYIVLYLAHPLIDAGLERADAEGHGRAVAASALAYLVCGTLVSYAWLRSDMADMLAKYVLVRYVRDTGALDSPRAAASALLASVAAVDGCVAAAEVCGMALAWQADRVLACASEANVADFALGLSIMALMRTHGVRGRRWEALSSTTLLTYLVSDNPIVRDRVRSHGISWLAGTVPYRLAVPFTLMLTAAAFACLVAFALVWRRTVGRVERAAIGRASKGRGL